MEPETTYKVGKIEEGKTVNRKPYTQIEVTVINKKDPKEGGVPEGILKEIKNEHAEIDWIVEGFQSLKEGI